MSFYMMAGTIASEYDLQYFRDLLAKSGYITSIEDDELFIDGKATLILRTGFQHEYILVGDCNQLECITRDTKKLSKVLQHHGIQHGFEIYDPKNMLIEEFEYLP